jgi:23S rRNA pseudouridine2605 synthase
MPHSPTPPGSSVKLAKYLADAGVAARRKAELLILAGRVKVNGVQETNVATRVIPGKDEVAFDGKSLTAEEEIVVLALNKPRGVISAASDPHGKRTVIDLVPASYRHLRLFPIGRLDEDSDGLILLTNNGDLAYRYTHPTFHVPKTYLVWIQGNLTRPELMRLRTGVPLKDGRTEPAEVEVVDGWDHSEQIEITIHEGRNRQVRRMMQHVNHEVTRLQRVRIGEIELGELQTGHVRVLSPEEYQLA